MEACRRGDDGSGERSGGIKGVALRLLRGYKAERATPAQFRWLLEDRICRRYNGWTFDYVRSLSVLDVHRIIGVMEAEAENERLEAEKAKMRRANKGRRR